MPRKPTYRGGALPEPGEVIRSPSQSEIRRGRSMAPRRGADRIAEEILLSEAMRQEEVRKRTEQMMQVWEEAEVTVPAAPEVAPGVSVIQARKYRAVAEEWVRRLCDALKMFEPLQMQREFLASDAYRRVARGSNRSGKTTVAAIEVATAIRNLDKTGKYDNNGGKAVGVGSSYLHCGKIMWAMIAHAGAFHMLRDKETGLWRAYRPWCAEDYLRKNERKPAPPMIPPSFIRHNGIAWEDKRLKIPKAIDFETGWDLTFFSADADPSTIQGWKLKLAWFDEEIEGAWPSEVYARLTDLDGYLLWSATPQAGTEALYLLRERSEKEDMRDEEDDAMGRPRRHRVAKEFHFKIHDNPHISEEQRERLEEDITDDEEHLIRIEGEFAMDGLRVYPEFRWEVHGYDPFPMPHHWTRYMAIDPGVRIAAMLFCAVPPPGEADDCVFFYDESYVYRANAASVADDYEQHTRGHPPFQDWVLDKRYGRQPNAGTGKSTAEHYQEAFRAKGQSCLRWSSSGFTQSSDDIDAGVTAVKTGLALRRDGRPRFMVSRSLKLFRKEIKRYPLQRVAKTRQILNTPSRSGKWHLMDCFRYLASIELAWVAVAHEPGKAKGMVRYLEEKKKRKQASHGQFGRSCSLG